MATTHQRQQLTKKSVYFKQMYDLKVIKLTAQYEEKHIHLNIYAMYTIFFFRLDTKYSEDISNVQIKSSSAPSLMIVSKAFHKHAFQSSQDS